MFGSSASAAVHVLLRPLQRSLSCVTRAVLVEDRTLASGTRVASLGDRPVPLGGAHRLGLSVLVAFGVERAAESPRSSWQARVSGYAYEFQGADGGMLLAFHWHPVGLSPVTTPHVHLGGPLGGIDLSKAHVPTGPVALQDVLRFAITDLGVRPLREDWRDVLTAPPSTGP